MSDLYIGEYNPEQKAFHVQPLEKACQTNLKSMLFGESNLWVPVCFGTQEYVSDFCEKLESKL